MGRDEKKMYFSQLFAEMVVILSSSRHGAGLSFALFSGGFLLESRNPLFIEAWGGTRDR